MKTNTSNAEQQERVRCSAGLGDFTWQPIKTAPKDGTHLLLWYPDYHRKVWVGHYYSTEIFEHGKLKRKSEGWHNDADMMSMMKECKPTHWMLLPQSPNAELSGQPPKT